MDDLNVVIMIGRLVFDPEVKESETGKKKVKIRIAVSRGKDKAGKDKGAYFFNGQAYGKTADAIAKYGTKGRLVSLQGKLCEWTYEKDDGEKRYYTVVNIDTFRLLDKPKTSKPSVNSDAPLYDASKPGKAVPMNKAAERIDAARKATAGGPATAEDDLPF